MNELNQPRTNQHSQTWKTWLQYKQKSAVHISALTSGQLAEETMAVHSQCAPGRYQAVPSYWTVQSILRMYQSLIKFLLRHMKNILTLSNHPGRWFVVVLPKHLARKFRWMNSGLSNRGMILRNFRVNQFNLNSIYISLVENTITFL